MITCKIVKRLQQEEEVDNSVWHFCHKRIA